MAKHVAEHEHTDQPRKHRPEEVRRHRDEAHRSARNIDQIRFHLRLSGWKRKHLELDVGWFLTRNRVQAKTNVNDYFFFTCIYCNKKSLTSEIYVIFLGVFEAVSDTALCRGEEVVSPPPRSEERGPHQ